MERKIREIIRVSWSHSRKAIILILGTATILVGIALIVLPGPAFIVIPAGLLILSTEFEWAHRLTRQCRVWLRRWRRKVRFRRKPGAGWYGE